LLFILFLSHIRRPLTSTLFPYTTLFRSSALAITLVPRGKVFFNAFRLSPSRAFLQVSVQIILKIGLRKNVSTDVAPFHHQVPKSDRKSTRLNSSHVAISYAVFCLKKKKP